MAAPGFSVSELIEAAVKTKRVYDAFFHKYDNASNRVRNLRDTVEQFRLNLSDHEFVLEQSGRQYPGLDAFNRTLTECNEFIRKYANLLDNSRARPREALRTLAWTFEDKNIGKLTRQLQLHIQALNGFTLNLLLRNAMERDHLPEHSVSNTLNVHIAPSQSQLPQLQQLSIAEPSPTPQLLLTRASNGASDNDLLNLWNEVQLINNRNKRRENLAIQSQRTLSPTRSSRRASVSAQAHQEIQMVVEKWKRIARNNGVDERHLPQISAEQPLETAEEFWKRVSHASELASQADSPNSPLRSPQEENMAFLNSPQILPAAPSGSVGAQTPNDSIWTRQSNQSITPNSVLMTGAAGLEPLDLPPPGVMECSAKLTLRHKTSEYPTIDLKRLEVKQKSNSSEIVIICTTLKGSLVQHKLPRGAETYPYTKHKLFQKPREVSFLESHRVKHGNATYTGDLTYKFFSDSDCKGFQDSIRGKDLVHTFEIDKIAFRNSNNLGEATDQHLKVWREFDGGQFSLTFFANNADDKKGPRHREFALSRLDLATGKRRVGTVRLEFRVTPRRQSQGQGRGLGLSDLRGIPIGATPDAVELPAEPAGGSTPLSSSPHSPRAELSPFPEAGDSSRTSPTIGPRRRSTLGQALSRVHPAGNSPTLDEQESKGPLDEEAQKLRFMDITFTDPEDADRFSALIPKIQQL